MEKYAQVFCSRAISVSNNTYFKIAKPEGFDRNDKYFEGLKC